MLLPPFFTLLATVPQEPSFLQDQPVALNYGLAERLQKTHAQQDGLRAASGE
jgi:hypothetical protein